MRLLVPLGLLGLLGIIVLIIIYIIKPNYQQKFISSTHVWKLSLKYRKKRIPTSKLRNILLILCQILIIAACAAILSQPNQILKEQTEQTEVIAVIDSSASMRAQTDGYSRFERAADGVAELAGEVFSKSGVVSVVVADSEPYFLAERVAPEGREGLEASVRSLVEEDACSYGTSDVDGAIALCENILTDNPSAKIYLFTDTDYSYVPAAVTVTNVSFGEEWNAAILDAYAVIEENYYTFMVEVACYGRTDEVEVNVEVSGANAYDRDDQGQVYSYRALIECPEGTTQTIIFRNQGSGIEDYGTENVTIYPIDALYSYQIVNISIGEGDSFKEDDNFYIYGGQKEVLRIQYASSVPNNFFNAAFLVLQGIYADRWEIVFDEVKVGQEAALEGYDLYVFEHKMPESLPTDGVVFLVDPDGEPSGSGLRIGDTYDFRGMQAPLTAETSHEILNGVVVDDITVSRYVKIPSYEAGYEELLTCDGSPVLLVRNEEATKVAVLSFSLHYSNLGVLPEFPLLIRNLLNYFLPSTVRGNAFEVNERVSLNARGPELFVSGNAELTFDSFPATLALELPGTYDLTQTTYFGKSVTESIYVRIPVGESDIHKIEDSVAEPYSEKDKSEFYKDLLLYLAIALVALLFAEWWLQSREGM